MIMRSIQQPVYRRQKKGLTGAGLGQLGIIDSPVMGKTFEEYLMELFQGDLIQNGPFFEPIVSELTLRNIQRIQAL